MFCKRSLPQVSSSRSPAVVCAPRFTIFKISSALSTQTEQCWPGDTMNHAEKARHAHYDDTRTLLGYFLTCTPALLTQAMIPSALRVSTLRLELILWFRASTKRMSSSTPRRTCRRSVAMVHDSPQVCWNCSLLHIELVRSRTSDCVLLLLSFVFHREWQPRNGRGQC